MLARREQSLRGHEGDELIADPKHDGELFLLSDPDLQNVVEGGDAAG